ncbi:hypothetical protein WICPIJ_002405 [Wickerhamomyces pijperi]|uniref:Uncharacterized protein n=1 Tax=Wickerhamomyces pijperi TaxID=599730 RepID=A0A9P8Q9V4_WICPI|nr:hypothetical protein WICPIJ_002405 [Wickerhamomyces pijperi]
MPPKRQKKNRSDNNSKKHQTQEIRPSAALPISQEIFAKINKNTVPNDGETYLALVRLQAEEGDAVMFVSKEVSHEVVIQENDQGGEQEAEQEQELYYEEDTDDEAYHDAQEYIQDLTKLYEKITSTYQLDKSNFTSNLATYQSMPLPTELKIPSNFTAWHKFLTSTPPTLSILSQFDHELCIRVLTYLIKWVNKKMNLNLTMWCWGILMRLSDVLEVRDVGLVRALGNEARKVWTALKDTVKMEDCQLLGKFRELVQWGNESEHEDDQKETNAVLQQDLQCNSYIVCTCIIVIVSRFYGQRDLDPEFEY